MINKSRLEVDRMIDYLFFKEKLVNYRYFLFYQEENESQVIKWINDEDTFTLKDKENYFIDMTKEFMEKFIFIQNYFNFHNLPEEMLQKILFFIDEKGIQNFNKFLIQYERDNIRNIRIYKFNKIKKSIKREKIWNIPKEKCDNFYKSLLKQSTKGFEFSNNYNVEIDFKKFKEIFFQLPYLSDLFRTNFVISTKNKNQIKNFIIPFVKFVLHSPENDKIFTFIFKTNVVILF